MTDSEDSPSAGYTGFAFAFLAVAAVLVVSGLYRMYAYDSTDSGDRIVGGDAYNYTILAMRGVGLITAGTASAVIAATFALFSVVARMKAAGQPGHSDP